jgi:hypothetical protein
MVAGISMAFFLPADGGCRFARQYSRSFVTIVLASRRAKSVRHRHAPRRVVKLQPALCIFLSPGIHRASWRTEFRSVGVLVCLHNALTWVALMPIRIDKRELKPAGMAGFVA